MLRSAIALPKRKRASPNTHGNQSRYATTSSTSQDSYINFSSQVKLAAAVAETDRGVLLYMDMNLHWEVFVPSGC